MLYAEQYVLDIKVMKEKVYKIVEGFFCYFWRKFVQRCRFTTHFQFILYQFFLVFVDEKRKILDSV